MSHYKSNGPLENYNSLLDKNLSGYFANTRMRRHLVRSGLVTKHGHITSENAYRLKIAKKEHRKHVRELLATAIVEKALDMERMRQYEIRKRLDELYKIELVQKVRSERTSKSNEELIALLSPRSAPKSGKSRKAKSAVVRGSEKETRLPDIHFDEKTRRLYYENNDSDNSSRRLEPKSSTKASAHTPHPPVGKKKKKRKVHRGLMLAKSNQLIAHRVQLQSMAEVTMKFLGSPLNLTNDMFPSSKLNEVQVVQQHCGASTVCVFRELLPANTVFTFVSRRHRGSPFGLTININGIKNIRVSSCCEYKHKPGNKIGGKNSQFALISVHGAAPCYRCQVRLNLLDSDKDAHQDGQVTSSDEEAAAESYDIIVSRGGKREQTIRPVSAHAATQTDAEKNASEIHDELKEKQNDSYQDDEFEDDEEKEFVSKVEPDESSESESESESEETDEQKIGASKEDKDGSSSSASSSSSSEDEEEEGDNEDGATLDDVEKNLENDEELDNVEGDSDVKNNVEEGSVGKNSSDSEDDEKKEESSSTEKEKSDGEGLSDEQSGAQASHVYLEDEVKEDSDVEESSKSSISSTGSDHSDSEEKEQNDDEKDDGGKIDGEEFQDEGDSSAHEDDENEGVKVEDSSDVENGSEDQLSIKEKESTPSIISRESTMLTGNEDGKCDDENKTIQFNEEVDVVTYEKVDVDPTPETTPRSDDEQDDSGTIQNGGERVVLANFDNIDIDSTRENDDSDGDKVEDDGVNGKEIDVEPEEDSDDDMLDKGHDPDEHKDESKFDIVTRETSTDSVQSLVDSWKDVDLANFVLSPEQTDELLISLDDNSDKVESISLRNTLVKGGIRNLKEVLKKAVNLKMLNLNETDINPDNAVHVADILADGQHQIKVLTLHGNPLGDDGISAIMDSLRHNTTLTNLDVSDCQVGDVGMKAIGTFLRENSCVTDLSISSNHFSASGWRELAEALKTNNTLSTLSVDSTNLLDEGVKVLCEGISENTSLVSLDIENNNLDDAAGEVLYEALQACKTLIDVTLIPNNRFSEQMENKIRSFIHQRIEQKNICL